MKKLLLLGLIFILSACSGGDNDDNDNNIDNPFSGEWSGVYNETIDEDGIGSGTWQGTVVQNNFSGEYISLESNETNAYSGLVSADGDTSFTGRKYYRWCCLWWGYVWK
jgi:hypothetical protein